MSAYFKPTSDTVFPRPDDPLELSWKLRHSALTRSEDLVAASVVDAYGVVANMTIKEFAAWKRAWLKSKGRV